MISQLGQWQSCDLNPESMFSTAPLPPLSQNLSTPRAGANQTLLKQSGLAIQRLVLWSETKHSPAVRPGFKSQLSHVLAMTLGKQLCHSEP